MKILVLKNYDLVWKEATYSKGSFLTTDDDYSYGVGNIFAIKDDDRNKTVICSHCGKEIKNTPSAIKAHRNIVDKPNKCFECRSLRKIDEVIKQEKFTLNEDGTYTETTKRNVKLVCKADYWKTYDINSPEARRICRYAGCQTATFRKIEDFWTKYPDAFNEFITIDRIIDTGYKSMRKYGDYIKFELKGKGNLSARVNNKGICFEIQLSYKRRIHTLRYSKKYDKVWVADYGEMRDLSYVGMSEDAEEAIIKKLKALYK